MGADLFVGSDSLEGLETALESHLADLGLTDELRRSFKTGADIATLCFLNVASIEMFLQHVGAIEGRDPDTALAAIERGDTQFKHMPYWLNSIWLLFDFEPRGNLAKDPTLFIGSCQGLLRELTGIKQRSPLDLGPVPNRYDQMRQDILAFYRDRRPLRLDDADIFRWMWHALFDGATIAIESKSALATAPD